MGFYQRTNIEYVAECDRCGTIDTSDYDAGFPMAWRIIIATVGDHSEEFLLCQSCYADAQAWLAGGRHV